MANPDQLITPGLFVKVRLPIGEAHPALLVREQALQSDQGLKKVFVLQPKDEEGKPYFIKDARTSWSWIRRASRPGLQAGRRRCRHARRAARRVPGDQQGSQARRPGRRRGHAEDPPGKEPGHQGDFLVKARPFDPERDSSTRPVARPAAESAGGSPVATAGATGKSLIGDSAAAPAVPAAGSPAGTPKQSSQRPGPAPAHSSTRAGHDSGSSSRRGR